MANTTAASNLTDIVGATSTMLNMVPGFFAIAILMIGIGVIWSALRAADIC